MKSILRYFHPLEVIKRQRKRYVSTLQLPKFLTRVLDLPFPEIDDLANELEYIVLDFETTGLDCNDDLILSMGWVDIKQGKVDLSSAHHLYINNGSQVKPETAVINHIIPQMLSGGVNIHDAMMTFFEAARGKVIVAHACVVEARFMNKYLNESYHLPDMPLLWLDTLCIEKRMAKALNRDVGIDLTLTGVRERYGLPAYNSHNALADAVSTAELLLAIIKRIRPDSTASFGHLYKLSV
ncbi:exonuclease domain-containing protein [Aliivibrio kagoshimensis]|uniref:3'-5' exonuclease n=1 Tax=Aliivibrio kagoshimensis TaxID=2910230 RepID=UPI003D105AE3